MTRIAIVGGGPAGLMCAITAKRINSDLEIIIFEKNDIASTLLPTGGGRCNISHYSDDLKLFAQNYPRGEKFLYSIFNQFFIRDTIDFFESIGVNVYVQSDDRIFPKSERSLDVIFALKNEIKRLGIKVIIKEISNVKIIDNGFNIDNKYFEKLVVSSGGKDNAFLHKLGHNVIPQKPALSALEIKEKCFSVISGVSVKNLSAIIKFDKHIEKVTGDILYSHKGVTGPLVYKISSMFAQDEYSYDRPIQIIISFVDNDIDLQTIFDENPQKEVINVVSAFIPKSLAKILLGQRNILPNKKCHQINKNEREIIKQILTATEIHAVAPIKGGEIVSAGGIDLNEINPKTMESKLTKNLYFCGEVLNIDGFCGGYNLQNCWSTGYVAGLSL